MSARLAFTVSEAAQALGIGRTHAYDLVRRGSIPHIRIGRCIRIPESALSSWIEQQTTTTGKSTK